MATYNNTFYINGVIDTSKTVLQNLETIATAAGAWLSYDIAQGQWAVVINQTGSSVASFTDKNIIGGINISSTGLTELYNSVEIEYPHKDLKDRKDYISFEIADADRYPNEPNNKLQISFDIVNNPIQAQLLASRELKQSRVDKVIEFRADFSYMGLKAGDLIDITNTAYGYTNKIFRIISLQEDDADDGVFSLSIRALEYDANVYSTDGLIYSERNIDSGIINKENNTEVKTKDGEAAASDLNTALLLAAGVPAVLALLSSMTSGLKTQGVPTYSTGVWGISDSDILDAFNLWVTNGYGSGFDPGEYVQGPAMVVPSAVYNLKFEVESPVGSWYYNTGSGTQQLASYIPGIVSLLYGTLANGADASVLTAKTSDWQTPITVFNLINADAGYYWVVYSPVPTYDLSKTTPQVYPTAYDIIVPQTSGAGITITGYIFDR